MEKIMKILHRFLADVLKDVAGELFSQLVDFASSSVLHVLFDLI
jgi:hypothetical protein